MSTEPSWQYIDQTVALTDFTAAVEAACEAAEPALAFITLDTEFIRQKTYYADLCLVQVAGPDGIVGLIDPLAEGIDLAPLRQLLCETPYPKIFHAATQDLEIFQHLWGELPRPVLDTQVMAMVDDYGDSVGYAALVNDFVGISLDKTNRFSDWSQRPLSQAQLAYAAEDVIHLRPVYVKLRDKLGGHMSWAEEEMAKLADGSQFENDPQAMWQKLKYRSADRHFLAVLQVVAAWRETQAQTKNRVRHHVLRDDAVLELASQAPTKVEEISFGRSIPESLKKSSNLPSLLEAIAIAKALPEEVCPELPKKKRKRMNAKQEACLDLLKLLLKFKARDHKVAAKLITDLKSLEFFIHDKDVAAELEKDSPDFSQVNYPFLRGWRYDVFGQDALAVLHGDQALKFGRKGIELIPSV